MADTATVSTGGVLRAAVQPLAENEHDYDPAVD